METDKGISDTHEMVGGASVPDSKRENIVFSFVKNNHDNEKTSLLIGEAKMFEAYGGNLPFNVSNSPIEPKNIKLKGVTFYNRTNDNKYTVEDTKINNITVTEDSIGSKVYRSLGLRDVYEKLASGANNVLSKERKKDESESRTEKTAKEIYDDKDDVAYLVINDTEGKHVYCAVIPYKGDDENEFNMKSRLPMKTTKEYSGIILPGENKDISSLSQEMLKQITNLAQNQPVKT